MDFIRVTLVEQYKEGKISGLRNIPEHLLPLSGISSISPNILKGGDNYIIHIIEHYKPKEEFQIGHAEAKLPPGFIHQIN